MSAVTALAAVMVPAPRPPVDDGAVGVLPQLFVPEACQWLSTTAGRVATDGYSWMQAVHWVAGSGLYQPRRHRSTGIRAFNATTLHIAQLLAELSPCFPGVIYLQRRTGLCERTVEYHLAALRETGLLVYISKGTRARGKSATASEFARMIPPEFDQALGIRTKLRDDAAPAYTRVMTGVADAGRELMAKLGKKASRKKRRPRKASSKAPVKGVRKAASGASGTAVSGGSRCTPMQVGTSSSTTAGATTSPPENKLASGEATSPTPKKPNTPTGGPRKLNTIGRRYQLGRELTQELDWLRGCSVPRIAWVARDVADAGWTVADVRGWLHMRGEAGRVRRGSGLLAVLLAGAEKILDTPEKRASAIEQWRGAQEASRRHRIHQVRARNERFEGDWTAPASHTVRRQVEAAFDQVRETATGGRHQHQDHVADDPAAELELSEQALADLRATAAGELMGGETTLITSLEPDMAVRIFGADLVRRAKRLASGARSTNMTYGRR
ncbi:transcriptional regulator [Streptomyces sp. NPDC058665]|uniref:transcriptional regulator n=1 Tax=Streptomyces sp. NPDC058665 TaxID=3346586 RepID=UPI003647EF12